MPIVPITAAGTPAADSPPSRRRVVVVLPWVPVTPIIRSRAAGSPYTSAEARPGPADLRYDDDRHVVVDPGRAGGVGEHGDRPGLAGLAPVRRAVAVRAGQGGVQVAGRDPPRVESHATESDAEVARAASRPPSPAADLPGRRGEGTRRARSLATAEAIEPDRAAGHHVVGRCDGAAPVGGTPYRRSANDMILENAGPATEPPPPPLRGFCTTT